MMANLVFNELTLIQSECGKIETRKTPNTDIFHAVYDFLTNAKLGL